MDSFVKAAQSSLSSEPNERCMPRAISRRAFVGAAAACASAAALGLSACAEETPAGDGSGGVSGTLAPEDRELMGSPDACDVRVGYIMGPPSMGLSQVMLAGREGTTFNRYSFEIIGVDYSTLAARFNQGDFDIVTLPSNLGPIIYNNHEVNASPRVICLNNLGVLYVITTDPSITELTDLSGRTAYAYGEGGTPEYTIEYLLHKAALSDSVNVAFKSTPFEILNFLQEEENAVAILPQPFVEVAKLLVPNLLVPIDLTEEWDYYNQDTGSQTVTTATLVTKEFLEAHEQAVIEYVALCQYSVQFTAENLDEAASYQEELETFLSNDIAKAAIPECSIVATSGVTMYKQLSGFLEALYSLNPDSIGGALPGDEFYWMPPTGYLEGDGVLEGASHVSAADGQGGGGQGDQAEVSSDEAEQLIQKMTE